MTALRRNLVGAVAGNVAVTAALVALNRVTTATTTAGSRLSAVAREVSRLAAVVAVATAAATTTTASTLGAVPRHVTLLIAVVAGHGAAAAVSATTTLTRLRAITRQMPWLSAIVASTVTHFD